MRLLSVLLASQPGLFDFLKPIGSFFWALRIPVEAVLGPLYRGLDAVAPIRFIGAYGVAVIVMTVIIKTLLFPVFQTQLKLTKRTQAEQKKVAPELAELRKKYKKDPQKLNTEMMALYKEHGINPLSSMAGCLPMLVQIPVIYGMYGAFRDSGFYTQLVGKHGDFHFLWISNVAHGATAADPVTWILPLLAGATTFVQSKMFTPPADPNADASAAQAAQISSSMSLLMPGMIIFFSFQPQIAQALVLYWIVSNLFSIGQQYFVNGWGQLPILGSKTIAVPAADGPNGRNQKSTAPVGKVLATEPQGAGRRSRRR